MDVAVDETRDEMSALRVNDLRPVTDVLGDIPNGDDPFAGDGHLGRVDLLGEHVDQLTASDHQVSRMNPCCDIEQLKVHHRPPSSDRFRRLWMGWAGRPPTVHPRPESLDGSPRGHPTSNRCACGIIAAMAGRLVGCPAGVPGGGQG